MTYTRLGPFVDGGAPYLSAATFNHLEDGIAGGPAPTGGDDTAALQAYLTAAAGGKTARLGAGTFTISAGLTLPSTASLILEPGTTIRATTTITGSMLTVGDGTNSWQGQTLRGGLWDCNTLAANAVTVRNALASSVVEVTWTNPTMHGLIVGLSTDAGSSHEITVTRCKGNRTVGAAPPAGSYGVWMQNAFDSLVEDTIIVGAQRSFRNDVNGNTFRDCHAYGIGNGAAQYPLAVFSENGSDSEYYGCYADTPKTYGWELTANTYRCKIIGGKVYNNSDAPDNVVIGVHTANADPNDLTIVGLEVFGQTASNRVAVDYDGNVPSPRLYQSANMTGSVLNVVTGNLAPRTGIPAVTTQGASGAGTNPPAVVIDASSTDRRGKLTFGSGTAPAAGVVVWVTFTRPFKNTPVVMLACKNYPTTQLNPFVQSESTTSFAITAGSAPAASQGNGTYSVEYTVTE